MCVEQLRKCARAFVFVRVLLSLSSCVFLWENFRIFFPKHKQSILRNPKFQKARKTKRGSSAYHQRKKESLHAHAPRRRILEYTHTHREREIYRVSLHLSLFLLKVTRIRRRRRRRVSPLFFYPNPIGKKRIIKYHEFIIVIRSDRQSARVAADAVADAARALSVRIWPRSGAPVRALAKVRAGGRAEKKADGTDGDFGQELPTGRPRAVH